MIRAAIVGIGWWGRMLVNAVQGKSAAIRFTAGYTRTRATAEGFCAEHSIALANDLDALLADPAVDAIVFATPHSQHGPQVERAAAAGKPVFMEKLSAALPSFGRGTEGAHRRRAARRLEPLPERADGTSRPLDARRLLALRPGGSAGRGNDRDRRAQCRSLIHLFGRIDEVYCLSHRRVMARLEDTTAVLFGLANGMSATLYCSLVTAVSARFAVFGTKGCAELWTPEFQFRFSPTPEGPRTGRHAAAIPEIIEYKGFNTLLAELEAFAAASEVAHTSPPPGAIICGVTRG